MHAVKTVEPARFWRVFGWFVARFAGFVRNALRPSGGADKDVMVNVKNISLDKKV